jgi:hypothetical protein
MALHASASPRCRPPRRMSATRRSRRCALPAMNVGVIHFAGVTMANAPLTRRAPRPSHRTSMMGLERPPEAGKAEVGRDLRAACGGCRPRTKSFIDHSPSVTDCNYYHTSVSRETDYVRCSSPEGVWSCAVTGHLHRRRETLARFDGTAQCTARASPPIGDGHGARSGRPP